MKKILLFSLALSLSFAAMADGKKSGDRPKNEVDSRSANDLQITPSQVTPIVTANYDFKGTQAVERVYIGKSSNIWSVLLEEQRYLDYNPEIGTYAFTFRTDKVTYGTENSGDIITATSSNGGDDWTDTWMMHGDDACRYPSGVLYNPNGNTDPNEAYIITCGPVNNDGWTDNFHATSKVNGDNLFQELIPLNPDWSGGQYLRNGLQVCSDGMAHVIERRYQADDDGYSTEFNIAAWYADFNGSGFDWDLTEIPVDLAMRTGGDHPGTTKNLWSFGNTWSNDGSVGYTWMIGVDDALDGESGYSPIVFRTENQGQDWDQIEIDLADNEVMSEYLWATDGFEGPMWPNVSELDGVVDNDGKLQLFVKATGTYSSHTDSVGWTYSNNLDYIYNIEINMDGVQEVYFVDSIISENVDSDSQYGFGTETWNSRLRATRTEDGTAVFAVWCDTENPEDFEGQNGAPNIKAGGRFVDNGDFTDFPVTNFTSDDLYAGFYFYHNVGQICSIENDYVQIPVVTSITPAEFSVGNESATVTHSFVKGVKFPWTVGLNKLEAVSNIAVSQNSPNPFTGTTTIELTSTVSAPVLIEVSNLMGQLVYTMDAGIINNTMKVELPARDLQSGVYFYTVTIGNESISKKMIVE